MNAGFSYREIVDPASAGRTLLDHLARRYRHSSSAEWRARIAAGRVLLDGVPSTAGAVLRAGREIVWKRPPWDEPEAPLAWALLHLDADLMAAAKPAGLPTLPGGGFLEHTLLALVRRRFPDAAPAHRLDRGTSGVVLFGRHAEAARRLADAFRSGRVDKEYRALVRGAPERDAFVVASPIGRLTHPRLGRVHVAAADGPSAAARPARSEVRVLERMSGETLVAVHPVTGRPHQIRVHLAAAGHPLAGDPLYAAGGGVRDDATACGAGGFLLHARRLLFDHPATGRPIALECAPPPALRTARERV